MGLLYSRFNKPETGVMHTSGIAASGTNTFGGVAAEDFVKRKQIEHNRQYVRSFRSAGVLTSHRDTAFLNTQPSTARATIQSTHSNPRQTVPIQARTSSFSNQRGSASFREPTNHRYNPYS
ncbi:hypothetical protein EOL96_01930 [Candidatus Saccharibacteria bacterium]|nr:hypothetical protein [Candidatus Saccharibacteria bacterium]